ncbi:MAG: pirin family protein, partial [Planctomycetota bacterium]
MIRIRRSEERGRTHLEWLDSRHTFSFGHFLDPAFMGYRVLRVLNDDRVGPGGGFPTHPHRDMEILTWVVEGGLEHEDSMGNASVIGPGELQRMTAGSGVTHSELNHSP